MVAQLAFFLAYFRDTTSEFCDHQDESSSQVRTEMHKFITGFSLAILIVTIGLAHSQQVTILRNVTVIDGTGTPAQPSRNVVIRGDRVASIQPPNKPLPKNAAIVDLSGKIIMPELINTHGHLGILKGTATSSANYTEENIRRQLLRYEAYGVGAVLSMGTDHEEIFALRDASHQGKLSGALIFTAGFGFGEKNGVPPASAGMDHVNRPETPEQARAEVRELASRHPDVLKVWVDDFWGQLPKMPPEVYGAIIDEAHQHNLRVAAHVYHLEDARRLVNLGVDILAHSIRDAEIDDALIAEMKKRNVDYIPTLSLDEFAFAYQDDPSWLNDPFFQAALEPGVLQMITTPDYKKKTQEDKKTPQEMAALQTAMKNLKKIHQAGILVALGSDSGANPLRAQGFAEHMELQLMVQAGLTPLQAISVGTQNAARVLRIADDYGTLQRGKKANFIVLDKDPSTNIENTHSIVSVWKNGLKVNDGPLKASQ